jgi:SAM-dependent methyltransferase
MYNLDFSRRSELTEWMDTEDVSFEEFRACLSDLARVNRLTLAYRPTLKFLERVARAQHGASRPLEIVDVGSGYGDMLREIAAWARRRGVPVSLTGIDLHPWSQRAAVEATRPECGIRWVQADALAYTPPNGIDVVVSSLFTHHLPDPLVVRFIAWMEQQARVGWFINDLHRHPLPYHFFQRFAKLARYHRFVQHDGPISIARAFSSSDWCRLLREAGVDPSLVSIAWNMPFRLTVGRLKSV